MPRLNPRKLLLAHWLSWTRAEAAFRGLQRLVSWPHLRVVNYHDVPSDHASAFESQLRFFRRHFAPATPDDLEALRDGRWRYNKPGLILTFDDGYRSHAEIVAPLLRRHGFVGWFFVPAAFPSVPAEEQLRWAYEHRIFPSGRVSGNRVAMTWEQVRRLDGEHVVGCHTMSHCRLAASLSPDELEVEIARAKERLEAEIGHEVGSFCWVGGEERSYSAAAAEAVRRAGFRWSFLTNNAVLRPGFEPLGIQRTNVEAGFPDAVTRFQLSGVLDLLYWPKRRRVSRLVSPPS